MALKLIANYSKRLGLPGYSSHQFSITVEVEISNVDNIGEESARLYQTLQESVDQEIQHTGFVPGEAYGQRNGNGAGHGNSTRNGNGNGHTTPASNGANGHDQELNGESLLGKWACSQKQQDLILKLIEDNQLSKLGIEKHAKEMFGKGVKYLDTKDASVLIEWMFGLVTTATGRGRRPAYRR